MAISRDRLAGRGELRPLSAAYVCGGDIRAILALLEAVRRRGLARAKLFTWEKAARETMQVYQEVLG